MENFNFSPNTLLIGIVVFTAILLIPRLKALFGGGAPFVSVPDLKKMIDSGESVTILDVRTPEEFVGPLGHIPGSGNLPLGELQGRLKDIGDSLADHKSEPLIIVCRTHNRSPKAADALRRLGFSNVMVLKGGLTQWNAENLPVEGKSAA